MTLMPTQEQVDVALVHIHAAMIFADRIFEEEAQDHARNFAWLMRTEAGMPLVAFRDEFVPYETTRSALWLLVALEKIETRLRAVEALVPDSEPQGRIDDEFRPAPSDGGTSPILPEQAQDKVVLSIAGEKHRLRQRLDKHRQQAAGVTHYIWQTRGDDHVRPEHAANNGKTFRWDDPPPTGHPGEDFGCRCVAIPSPEEVQPPDDPPIEEAYWLDLLAGLALRLLGSIALAQAERMLGRLRQKPQKDPVGERPDGVPEDWQPTPSRKGEGTKYVDPKNPGTYVRTQRGNPNSRWPNQRQDYVRWQKNGRSLDVNGNPVPKDSPEAHIPIEEFHFKPEIFE